MFPSTLLKPSLLSPETEDLIYLFLLSVSFRSPFHLPRLFLTDRLSLTNSGIPTFEEQVSRHLILSRLRTLKTTIEVNQFFPHNYFSQRFNVERTFNQENFATFETLRAFIKKYRYLDLRPSHLATLILWTNFSYRYMIPLYTCSILHHSGTELLPSPSGLWTRFVFD